MTLVKSGPKQTSEVRPIITPRESRKVEMGIGKGAMQHILRMLTDAYQDPIAATVREIVSNAVDATVLCPEGERQPVEVLSPTALRPMFVVKDHGVGMTPAMVEENFIMYGASTKGEDFLQIGAFGLGAKAPLAYCSEFSVVTTRDGVTTSFKLSRGQLMNEADILSVEETGLPNGTTVTVPVTMSDLPSFVKNVDVYRKYSFDVPVLLDGVAPDPSAHALLADDFLLDVDEETGEETKGRVWIRKDSLVKCLDPYSFRSYSPAFTYGFVLSGWLYNSPSSRGQDEPDLLFELKPGVVDFSNSRDGITANERSMALVRRVTEAIPSRYNRQPGENAGFHIGRPEDVFSIYRTFTRAEAKSFVSKLASSFSLTKDAFEQRTHYGTAPGLKLPVSSFTTDEGYNPLELITADYPLVVTAGFHTGPRNSVCVYGVRQGTIPGLLTPAPASSVADANESLLDTLEEGVATGVLFSTLYFGKMRPSSLEHLSKVVLLTEATADNFRKLLPFRKFLSENGYAETSFFVVAPGVEKELAEQVKLLGEHTDLSVETKTVEEFITEAKALRAKHKKPKAAPAQEFPAQKITDGYTREAQVTAARSFDYYPRSVTVGSLRKQNALLVISPDTHTLVGTLVGAANAGISVTDRPIYRAHERDLRAHQLQALADYEGLIFSQTSNPRSKIGQELKASRAYRGRVLHSALRDAKPSVVVSSLLNYNISRSFIDFLIQAIDGHERSAELAPLKRMSELFHSKEASYNYTDLSLKEAAVVLGEELASAVFTFRALRDSIYSSNDFTAAVVAEAFRSEHEATALTDLVMAEVLGRYLSLASPEAPAPA